MEEGEHHIQDALELYAVARLQELAESSGMALRRDSATKRRAFRAYAAGRGLTDADFHSGKFAIYMANLDMYLPCFFDRLVAVLPGTQMAFRSVEKEYRNTKRKGDFVIEQSDGPEVSVSLKNYRRASLRPQLSSGTFNSFPLGFLFESTGVGSFVDQKTRMTFRSSDRTARDEALAANGYDQVRTLMRMLDAINDKVRARFIDTSEFTFFNRAKFKSACVECGLAGVQLTLRILDLLDEPSIRRRLLAMTGMDGKEELLLVYPTMFTDSITVERFRELRRALQARTTRVRFTGAGQRIVFDFVADDRVLLTVEVPFTINRNGAWISGMRYDGKRLHVKEGVPLAWGERRPRKSRELATSTNTYVNFSRLRDLFVRGR